MIGMKKQIKIVVFILILLIIGLCGCTQNSELDDKNDNTDTLDNRLFGTWTTSNIAAPISYSFYSNGTYIVITPETPYKPETTKISTYSTNNGTLFLENTSAGHLDYSFRNNNQILIFHFIYGDLEYTKK